MLERTFTFWRRLVRPADAGRSGTTAGAATLVANDVDDRRLWVRYPAELKTIVQLADTESRPGISAQICDISRGGANLWLNAEVPTGQLLNIDLPRAEGGSYTVLACVVRSESAGEQGWSVGCVFSRELSDEDLDGFGARRVRPDAADQRSWVRFDCVVQAKFQQIGGDESPSEPAHVLNLSASGVGLVVERFIDAGALLSLDLTAKGGTVSRTILACVVHVGERDAGSWALGCNFIRELSDEDLRALL